MHLAANSVMPFRIRRLANKTRSSIVAATSYGLHKGRVDRVVAALLLIPALPVLGLLWTLVKLTSRGPGIYSQIRSGRDGREFAIYKLRTMRHNCERQSGAVWARPNDARVTTLGRILRKTHLDELPQLFNVLRGEMVLVGPRPERPEIIARLVPEICDYRTRLAVAPGVTGLAQIMADSDQTIEDVRRKLQFDQQYMARASLWLDLKIVVCTALKVVGLNQPFVRSILFPEFMQSRDGMPIAHNVPGAHAAH
jgi:lipopolysaccharide/colanic/teichoic acid biosynthesis glycosyltransferase